MARGKAQQAISDQVEVGVLPAAEVQQEEDDLLSKLLVLMSK